MSDTNNVEPTQNMGSVKKVSKFRLTLARKLPLIIVAAALTVAVAIGVSDTINASRAIKTEAQNGLTALLEARKSSLANYLEAIRADLRFVATNPTTVEAAQNFNFTWRDLGEGAQADLQRLYITDNPNPTGQKENLDFAPDGSGYSAAHGRYHPWFRQFLRERGYYDIFLFNTEGDLVYSVFKELDYATNMNSGEWRSTDLANVFKAGLSQQAAGSQTFFDFKPYAPSNDAPASFISTPIHNGSGQLIGVLAFQMPIDRLNAVMQVTAGMGETGEAYIIGEDHLMRTDSRFSEESTILVRKVDTESVIAALEGESGVIQMDDYRGVSVFSAFGALDFMGTRWAVIAEKDSDEVLSSVVETRNIMLIVALIVLGIVALIGVFVARGVSGPVTAMTSAMRELASGNKDVDIPGQARSDEIGDMAAAVQVFKENAVEAERLSAIEAEEVRKREERTKRMMELCTNFDASISEVVSSVTAAATETESTAQSMASNAEETSQQSAAVASATEQATANVQTVASAAEELASSIAEIARQVDESTKNAQSAVSQAEKTNETVKSLSEAGQKIGDVVQLINDIASQTNLLALNATIEAARAGEAGKGFAVVASEVKSLANQTAKATDEIGTQISTLQSATEEAVVAIDGIGKSIGEINETSTTVASAVEEQRAATGEISRNVQEAATGTQQVSSNITGVNEAAQQTGAAAVQMTNAASQLSEQADTLGREVEKFLSDIRAA
ncbi:MAG: HAMP domain-containing protein [Rhodospirillaceae bacterium]|nr:HAMP domain-containing protein [Rhodospirillaceae bacterium]